MLGGLVRTGRPDMEALARDRIGSIAECRKKYKAGSFITTSTSANSLSIGCGVSGFENLSPAGVLRANVTGALPASRDLAL